MFWLTINSPPPDSGGSPLSNAITTVQAGRTCSVAWWKHASWRGLHRVIWVEVSGLNRRGLSKSYQSQSELFGGRDLRWGAHGIVNPLSQLAVGEQV